MALEKLLIITEHGEQIKALFNPERYTINKAVQYAEIAIPGLDSPVLQFVRGQNEKLTLELFFDTTDKGMVDDVSDVREYTSKIHKLLLVDTETHAPPRCTIYWGAGLSPFQLSATCVVESVSEEFNLFSPQGIPLRAKLNLTLREYITIEDQLLLTPRHSSDRTKEIMLKRGETLSQVAGREYSDPSAWRRIAEENNLENPRLLTPGMKLRIPRQRADEG